MKRLVLAGLITTLSGMASAQVASAVSAPQKPLYLSTKRALSFPRAIGRVEVDREDVISVKAPTARSLNITAIGIGNAQLSVYATDGVLLGQTLFSVQQTPSAAGSAMAADPRMARIRSTRDGAGGVTLTGSTDSMEARSDAGRIAASTGEGKVINRVSLTSEQVVAVEVQFAAVSSSTLKALGFNFSKLSGDLQGAVISPSSLNSYGFSPTGLSINASAPLQNAFNLFLSGPNRGIGAVLSALSSNGLSQLLAEPTLLVRSGEQASFLAGGEVPIPVPQNGGGSGNSIAIQYKEFGVRLTVAPFVLSKERIVLKIAPEVSELDYANGVQLQGYVVPGLRRRSAETTVQLGNGQSFVIAGLTYSTSSITKDKTPLIGDLPIIGAFFKRQQNQKERQELIIVVTPRLVGPMDSPQLPPLPGAASAGLDPSFGDMIIGTDGLEQHTRPFGVIRR